MDGQLLLLAQSLLKRSILEEVFPSEGKHYFMFGRYQGLPEEFMRQHPEKALRIPMNDQHVKPYCFKYSLHDCLRGQNFAGLELVHEYRRIS